MDPKNLFVLDTPRLLPCEVTSPGLIGWRICLHARSDDHVDCLAPLTRMELLYLICREEGEEAARGALRLVESFTIEWITCEPSILEVAARLKARGRLSVADSWIGATAISRQAVLIHKDPEFAQFPEIAQEVLAK